MSESESDCENKKRFPKEGIGLIRMRPLAGSDMRLDRDVKTEPPRQSRRLLQLPKKRDKCGVSQELQEQSDITHLALSTSSAQLELLFSFSHTASQDDRTIGRNPSLGVANGESGNVVITQFLRGHDAQRKDEPYEEPISAHTQGLMGSS